ncbi:hypothetical protein F2Q68_00015797 [Brassica cretica]|uniref:Uncharacterized protein n=1 Tax=Brassica cretica TaxID=69181 RepID=A0A8S9HFW4_BRACR|nr:hypothetical protein F2Q68_00015797 [Brassica cretica]
MGSYIGVLDDPLHTEASRRGLRFRSDVDKTPTEAISNDIRKPTSIYTTTSPSIDTHRVSEHNEFEVCQNIFDGGTTTRSDKFGEGRTEKKTKGGS